MKNYLQSNVKLGDVLAGLAIGVGGAVAGNWALQKLNASMTATDATKGLPAKLLEYSGELGALAAGGIAFALQHKKKPERALGHLVGAGTAAVTLGGWEMLKTQFPKLKLNGFRGYGYNPYYPALNGHRGLGMLTPTITPPLNELVKSRLNALSSLSQQLGANSEYTN